MPIFACGVNHKTAPLDFRERMSFASDQMDVSLRALQTHHDQSVREVAILSTCNRTEFYCESDSSAPILSWLGEQFPCHQDELSQYFYIHKEEAAIRHMIRVASGLDSMVLGEPQILGQLKSAFAMANEVGTIGPQLQRLFQYVFSVTKEIRTSTGVGANPVSVAYMAVKLAKSIFTSLSDTSVMVLGAGETIELVLRYLSEYHPKEIYVINRTFDNAEKLANRYHGKPAVFSEISQYLSQVDIVISATRSPVPILGKGVTERALKQRRHRPFFMVDLAVPRDIEPEVGELDDVYLYSVDDLQDIIEESLNNRRAAADEAEQVIELQVDHYMRWLRSLDVVGTIRTFRGKIEAIRDQEMNNALQLLNQGASPEKMLCHLARNLTNKFMHTPTIQMRKAGYDQDLERLALIRQLFELDE